VIIILIINEIVSTLSGETKYAGYPTTLIRLLGCNLHCSYCIGVKPGNKPPKITLADKPNKRIQDVIVGDILLTVDDSGKLVETTVKNTMNRVVDNHYGIKIEGKREIFVTGDHPFKTTRGWVNACDLKLSDEIIHINPEEKNAYYMRKHNPMFNAATARKSTDSKDYGSISTKISDTRNERILSGDITFAPMSQRNKIAASERMKTNNPMKYDEVKKKRNKTCNDRGINDAFGSRVEEMWKNDEFKDNQRQRMHEDNPMYDEDVVIKNCISHSRKKSTYESKFEKMCVDNGVVVSYVGDNKLFIGTKNPDFIIPNTNKVIEVYSGTYGYSSGKTRRGFCWRSKLSSYYSRRGYKCLFVDMDAHNYSRNVRKILKYYHNGLKVEKVTRYDSELKVYNFTCSPYNTYLADNMLVHNCDTVEDPSVKKRVLSVKRVVNMAKDMRNKYVLVTGGEPLLQEETIPLVLELNKEGFTVWIETNGAVKIEQDDYRRTWNYTMDIKCPSSGMSDKNVYANLKLLHQNDEVKLVIGDRKDFDFAIKTLRKYPTQASVCLSPMFKGGKCNGGMLAKWMLEERSLREARLSLQIHKILNIQ
jgi:7-carboxy-7-deazaguanine synthase